MDHVEGAEDWRENGRVAPQAEHLVGDLPTSRDSGPLALVGAQCSDPLECRGETVE